jgi:hypothetical protein
MRIGVRRFIGQRILNHLQPGVDGIYDLHDYFRQKQKALRRWTNRVSLARLRGAPGKIRPFDVFTSGVTGRNLPHRA